MNFQFEPKLFLLLFCKKKQKKKTKRISIKWGGIFYWLLQNGQQKRKYKLESTLKCSSCR